MAEPAVNFTLEDPFESTLKITNAEIRPREGDV